MIMCEGQISRDKFEKMISDGLINNGVIFDQDEILELSHVILDEFGDDFSYEKLCQNCHHYPELCETFVQNVQTWLQPKSKKGKTMWKRLSKICQKKYWINHRDDFIFAFIFLIGLFFVMGQRISTFSGLKNVDGSSCYSLIIARATGAAINFLSTLLILLMTRPLLTRIRMSQISQYLPVDHHVEYHKTFGILLFIMALTHTICHLVNLAQNFQGYNYILFTEINNITREDDLGANLTYAEWLLTTGPKVNGLFPGLANPTGIILFLICIIMGIGAFPCIRQRGHFEVFYWTHVSYLVFFVVMILHCDMTIYWVSLPLFIFLFGKALMIKRWLDGRGKTYAVCGRLLPSKVTELTIRKTDDFDFQCGDWLFINIPTISTFEWHPFTIS